jgi:hypothetical protein
VSPKILEITASLKKSILYSVFEIAVFERVFTDENDGFTRVVGQGIFDDA